MNSLALHTAAAVPPLPPPPAQRLAIVSPDTGNNTVEGGTGDQPLFIKVRVPPHLPPLDHTTQLAR